MERKLGVLFVCVLISITPQSIIAQQPDPVLVVITAPKVAMPQDLSNSDIDEKIKTLNEALPSQLETLIFNFSNRKIEFLDRELLMELKEAINYEEPRGFLDAISDTIKINAVLLTKIEKRGTSQITIKAKIVGTNRRIISVRERTTHLEPLDKYSLNLEILAREIVSDLLRGSNFVERPIFWSGVATISSSVWFFIERSNVNNNYDRYKDSSTIEQVTKARIKTEKSEARRNIAVGATIASVASFTYFLIKPLIFKKSKSDQTQTTLNQDKEERVRIVFYPKFYDERASLYVFITF